MRKELRMKARHRKYKPSKRAIANFIAFIGDKPLEDKILNQKGVMKNGK